MNGILCFKIDCYADSPWEYIQEGSLSEGFVQMRSLGLILKMAYFGGRGVSEFYSSSHFWNHDFESITRGAEW